MCYWCCERMELCFYETWAKPLKEERRRSKGHVKKEKHFLFFLDCCDSRDLIINPAVRGLKFNFNGTFIRMNLFHWMDFFFLCLSCWRLHNLKFAPAVCGYAITWSVMELILCDGEQTVVPDSGWNDGRNRVRWAPPFFMDSLPPPRSRGSVWLPFCLPLPTTHAVSPSLCAAHSAIAAAASYPAHATMSEPLISPA